MEYSKCKWTPFAGMTVCGSVRRVTLRGEVVFVDGKILAKPGSGKNIAPLKPTKTLTLDKEFNVKISQIPETKNLKTKSLNQKSVKINCDSNIVTPNRVRAISTSTQNGWLSNYFTIIKLTNLILIIY